MIPRSDTEHFTPPKVLESIFSDHGSRTNIHRLIFINLKLKIQKFLIFTADSQKSLLSFPSIASDVIDQNIFSGILDEGAQKVSLNLPSDKRSSRT